MTTRRRFRLGFTLVELLTVIAIIAILAAIIFPVFSVVRKNVHKAQCTSNLHSIAQAIKMYKDDYRLYPGALYGYGFASGGGRTFLFPQYIKDKSGFHCPINSERIDSQKLAPGYNAITKTAMTAADLQGAQSQLTYFAWDSYDGSVMPPNSTNSQYVVHYLKKFTPVPPSAADEPRQLIYRTPPDNTVVTWCTYHRDWSNGQPQTGSMDLVLYLDGRVKPVPVAQTMDEFRAHTVTPAS
jgi:prepilin-type N-terminal cleavage/methylation domain-containing protein